MLIIKPITPLQIDRIINCFGRHYFRSCPGLFRHEDAAYVLSYSVIMLNTDRHNNQVIDL